MSDADGDWWIVVEYTTNPVEAVIVEAPSEREAAEAGAKFLWDEALERATGRDHPIDPPDHVFVAPWSGRVAYATDFVASARLAQHQCCGGGTHAEHVNGTGHWGGCPNAPKVA